MGGDRQKLRIVLIQPEGYRHSGALAELAETLIHGLDALGVDFQFAIGGGDDTLARDAVNIVLGAHLLDARQINIFDAIFANDVLEHVPDLITAMGNCLRLLKLGDAFHIQVPYDLSLGAWQDPTHVRAFNENSWLYYTGW